MPSGDREWERVAGACSTGSSAILGLGLSTLGGGTSTLGGGMSTLGRWIVIRAAVFALSLFRCSFAAVADCFAAAILVNSFLTLVNASAVLLPAGMLPLRAIASCWAGATTWDLGEIAGLVMDWCLKKTVSLILVALVLVT